VRYVCHDSSLRRTPTVDPADVLALLQVLNDRFNLESVLLKLLATGWLRLRERGLLAIAILVGAVGPAAVAGISGNLSIPHNDAWAYSRIARTFAETGQVHLLSWNRSALLGQIVPLGPLGASVVVQQLFVALLSAVFLVSVYELLRPRFGPSRAGVATVATAVWPGFALLGTSFMADVPTLAAAFAAILAGDRALRRDSRVLFVVAMLLGGWACTIRLQGIAAPAAIALVFLLHHKSLKRTRPWFVITVTVILLLAFAVFSGWLSGLPGNDPASLALRGAPFAELWTGAARGYFELALVAGPVALISSRPWRWGRRGIVAGGVTFALGVLLLKQQHLDGFFLPSYLNQVGSYGVVLPPATPVYSQPIWSIVVIAAIILGAVLAAALAERDLRAPVGLPVLTVFTLLTLLGTCVTFPTIQTVFGRYLIATAPWVIALLLPTPREERTTFPASRWPGALPQVITMTTGTLSLIAVGVLSASLMLHAFASDRARWDAGEVAVGQGVPADRVDAGLEWDGWHARDGVIRPRPALPWGRATMFTTTPSCVAVLNLPPEKLSSYEISGWKLQRVAVYRTFLVAGTSRLYVYDTGAASCVS
jgi:hypothetical protein